MKRLVSALMKPLEVAVVKCRGHSKEETEEARGNEAADLVAKKAAGYQHSNNMLQAERMVYDVLPKYNKEKLGQDQEEASTHEKAV